jgi:hypothetical protein
LCLGEGFLVLNWNVLLDLSLRLHVLVVGLHRSRLGMSSEFDLLDEGSLVLNHEFLNLDVALNCADVIFHH